MIIRAPSGARILYDDYVYRLVAKADEKTLTWATRRTGEVVAGPNHRRPNSANGSMHW